MLHIKILNVLFIIRWLLLCFGNSRLFLDHFIVQMHFGLKYEWISKKEIDCENDLYGLGFLHGTIQSVYYFTLLFFKQLFIFYLIWMNVLTVWKYTVYMPGTHWGQKTSLGPLKLELGPVVSCHVCSGNLTGAFCRNNECP